MRERIKTGILIASTSNNLIKKDKVIFQYKEKLFGNIIIKTIIKN